MHPIEKALRDAEFLMKPGFYAVVDGQYGSTGKGLLASVLAEHLKGRVGLVTSNAGPNSGHTSYYGDEKVVLRQLPTFSVMHSKYHGYMPRTHLNSGAIIEPECLKEETDLYVKHHWTLTVSRNAAVVGGAAKEMEKKLIGRIGSTGKGTGGALASKILRHPTAVFGGVHDDDTIMELVGKFGSKGTDIEVSLAMGAFGTVLAEVSQGFSLSLNAGGFYPYCTSRDCTVMQSMSDAGFHPSSYRDCAMVVRTFPIRVAGNSGPCHTDQQEITWDAVGQQPELTTVTQKVRRIFTWSRQQFKSALLANRPGVLMVNFMNYLPNDTDHGEWLYENVMQPYCEVMSSVPKAVLLGYGPKNEDVRAWDW